MPKPRKKGAGGAFGGMKKKPALQFKQRAVRMWNRGKRIVLPVVLSAGILVGSGVALKKTFFSPPTPRGGMHYVVGYHVGEERGKAIIADFNRLKSSGVPIRAILIENARGTPETLKDMQIQVQALRQMVRFERSKKVPEEVIDGLVQKVLSEANQDYGGFAEYPSFTKSLYYLAAMNDIPLKSLEKRSELQWKSTAGNYWWLDHELNKAFNQSKNYMEMLQRLKIIYNREARNVMERNQLMERGLLKEIKRFSKKNPEESHFFSVVGVGHENAFQTAQEKAKDWKGFRWDLMRKELDASHKEFSIDEKLSQGKPLDNQDIARTVIKQELGQMINRNGKPVQVLELYGIPKTGQDALQIAASQLTMQEFNQLSRSTRGKNVQDRFEIMLRYMVQKIRRGM